MSHHHGFDDEHHVARLEREAAEAAALHAEAIGRCAGHLHEPVTRVLDLGAGPGVTTALLAERFPAAEVVAVDNSPRMLASAAARGLRALEADLDGDLTALGAADLVWLAMVLHHTADAPHTLRAVAGLLAPGGLLCALEHAGHAEGLALQLEAAGLDVVERDELRAGDAARALVLARV